MILPVFEGKLSKKAKSWWMKKKIAAKLNHKSLTNRYKSPAVQEKIKEAKHHAFEMLGGL